MKQVDKMHVLLAERDPCCPVSVTQEAVQAAQAQHYPWLRDGIYAMLPYSAIILENTACAHPMTVP